MTNIPMKAICGYSMDGPTRICLNVTMLVSKKTKKHEGCRKRGRPQLRCKDCLKRDLRKVDEHEKWREKVNNGDQWKKITNIAVERSDH